MIKRKRLDEMETNEGNKGREGMKTRHLVLTRVKTVSLAAAMVLLLAAGAKAASVDLSANGGLLDQISNFAAQARAAGGSAVSAPNVASAPVSKFSADGRFSGLLSGGGCSNNPLESSCSADCDSVTMSGPVTATGLGKATLDACYTILLHTSNGACLNGLGIGTLTAANGNSIKLSFAGDFCVADLNMATVTIFFAKNLTYVMEGGTGPFATETGTGNLTSSDIIVNPMSVPFTVTGQFNMNGTSSKN